VPDDRERLDAGGVITAAITLWWQNFTLLTGLSFLISLGLASVTGLLEAITGASFVFADLLIGPLVSGLIVLLAQDALIGRQPALRPNLQRVVAVFWPLLLLSIAGSLLALGGMMLFVVPGLYVTAVLLPMVPLIVLPEEDKGWDAMSASWELARPHVWTLVWVVVALIAISLLASGPLLVVTGAMTGGGLTGSFPILVGGLLMFLGAAAGALSATIALTVYHRLRGLER